MKALEEKGAQRKKRIAFVTSSKNLQVKIIYLDTNLLHRLIYTGSHLEFKQ